jgi:hypothetical protein
MADFLVLEVPTIGKRKFIRSRPGPNSYSRLRKQFGLEMALIDAEDFEAGWSLHPHYIAPDLMNGKNDRWLKDARFERFAKFLAENEVIEMANCYITAGGRISFRDGRHRTRVLLNLGMPAIPVTMPKASLDLFDRCYTDRAQAKQV